MSSSLFLISWKIRVWSQTWNTNIVGRRLTRREDQKGSVFRLPTEWKTTEPFTGWEDFRWSCSPNTSIGHHPPAVFPCGFAGCNRFSMPIGMITYQLNTSNPWAYFYVFFFFFLAIKLSLRIVPFYKYTIFFIQKVYTVFWNSTFFVIKIFLKHKYNSFAS